MSFRRKLVYEGCKPTTVQTNAMIHRFTGRCNNTIEATRVAFAGKWCEGVGKDANPTLRRTRVSLPRKATKANNETQTSRRD